MSPDAKAAPRFFLKPGEIVFSSEPLLVTTLLGACVAVTRFSPRQRFGAICHHTGEVFLKRLRNSEI
jgi:chemotaxis receptor (MCP) glutamine deamidase CheD